MELPLIPFIPVVRWFMPTAILPLPGYTLFTILVLLVCDVSFDLGLYFRSAISFVPIRFLRADNYPKIQARTPDKLVCIHTKSS